MVNNSRRSEEAAHPFVVKGEIRDNDGNSAALLMMKAFNANLRSEELLGEKTTNKRGAVQL